MKGFGAKNLKTSKRWTWNPRCEGKLRTKCAQSILLFILFPNYSRFCTGCNPFLPAVCSQPCVWHRYDLTHLPCQQCTDSAWHIGFHLLSIPALQFVEHLLSMGNFKGQKVIYLQNDFSTGSEWMREDGFGYFPLGRPRCIHSTSTPPISQPRGPARGKFPANEAYAKDLTALTQKVGEELSKRGVVGYIAVDFVSVRQEDGTYKHFDLRACQGGLDGEA